MATRAPTPWPAASATVRTTVSVKQQRFELDGRATAVPEAGQQSPWTDATYYGRNGRNVTRRTLDD